MFSSKNKTSCIWQHKCHISDYQILPWNSNDPGRMFAKQKRTLLCFSFGFLSHWAGFVVLSPVAREWPRKTNISVREEGEPQYIPPCQPKIYLAATTNLSHETVTRQVFFFSHAKWEGCSEMKRTISFSVPGCVDQAITLPLREILKRWIRLWKDLIY